MKPREKPSQPYPERTRVDDIRAFDKLLEQRTGDKYLYCREKFQLIAPAGLLRMRCAELCERDRFATVIDRYATKFANADRRAVVSMWTMYYFSTLAISTAIFWLEMRRSLPLALEDVTVCLDPETAEPRCFVLANVGEEARHLDIKTALEPLLVRHAVPLIAAISENGGVARRLVWSNVVAYMSWIISETGRLTDPMLEAEGLNLLNAPFLAEGIPNPMLGLTQRASSGDGTFTRRRVCCLRYLLPEVQGCGDSCPLPGGRC